MKRTVTLAAMLLIALAEYAQTSYTYTLPTIEGSTLSNWRTFTFPGTTPTTGDGTLTFEWRACWQDVFGSSSKIWIEFETSPGSYTQVYYETGNNSDCVALSRTTNVSAPVLINALNTGNGDLNGRVKVQDACYPGVGCAFYNDPQVLGLTLTYDTHAANFTAVDAGICPGGIVQFTDASVNSPSSYEWLFPGGDPATSALQDPAVQYNTPGSYDVTLIVVTTDGPDTLTIPDFVTVNDLPLADAGADETVCAGNSVQLQAGGGTTYEWFPATGLSDANVDDPVATPAATTSYTVLVTDANGCQASDFVVLTVQPLPQVVASAGNNTICLGDTAYIVATGASLYQWSPNLFISGTSGAAVYAWPTSTFSWTVTGTDAFGCVNDTTYTLNVVPPPAAPTVTFDGADVTTAAVASAYQWYLNGQIIPGATQQSWTPTMNGNYSVTITDANGCTAQSLPVYYGSVGLQGIEAQGVRVHPQPAGDLLVIEGIHGKAVARLYDAGGRVVLLQQLDGTPRATLSLMGIPSGSYVLEVEGAAGVERMPVVRE
ncbi:MAG: hypothetical protein H6595_02830 [Flavobacteriales bacterium]|nr:hypothetical protein [Flavobacteriales bacterium]